MLRDEAVFAPVPNVAVQEVTDSQLIEGAEAEEVREQTSELSVSRRGMLLVRVIPLKPIPAASRGPNFKSPQTPSRTDDRGVR